MEIKDLLMFRNNASGNIGIELEYEGESLPFVDNSNWRTDSDGSLRGGVEYVLKNPVKLNRVKEVLSELIIERDLDDFVNPTYRAGTHIHINVRDLTPVQIINFFVLYGIFEESLVKFCEEERRNNLFCVTIDNASGYVGEVVDLVQGGCLESFSTDNIRYSSINLTSVPKYGSIESRILESTTDIDKIYTWSAVLESFKKPSKMFKDPREIMRAVSAGNITTFCNNVLGKEAREIVAEDEEWGQNIRRGLNNMQDLCFCKDWGKESLYIFGLNKDVFNS